MSGRWFAPLVERACRLVPSATFLNTDATRPDFDPSVPGIPSCVSEQVTKSIRNREARVTQSDVA